MLASLEECKQLEEITLKVAKTGVDDVDLFPEDVSEWTHETITSLVKINYEEDQK